MRTEAEKAELRRWLASRKRAGAAIDIETCELGHWGACEADPYGILKALGELPEEMTQLGTCRFVRAPDSDGWVNEGDLPIDKARAMYARIERGRIERERKAAEELAAATPPHLPPAA